MRPVGGGGIGGGAGELLIVGKLLLMSPIPLLIMGDEEAGEESDSVYATGNQPVFCVRKFSPNCQPLFLSPNKSN